MGAREQRIYGLIPYGAAYWRSRELRRTAPSNNEMQLTGRGLVGRACAFAHAGVIVSRPAADLGVLPTRAGVRGIR